MDFHYVNSISSNRRIGRVWMSSLAWGVCKLSLKLCRFCSSSKSQRSDILTFGKQRKSFSEFFSLTPSHDIQRRFGCILFTIPIFIRLFQLYCRIVSLFTNHWHFQQALHSMKTWRNASFHFKSTATMFRLYATLMLTREIHALHKMFNKRITDWKGKK